MCRELGARRRGRREGTHVVQLVAEVEGDDAGDGLDGEQELALLLAHLGKLQQEGKVLRQVPQVLLRPVLNLKEGAGGGGGFSIAVIAAAKQN